MKVKRYCENIPVTLRIIMMELLIFDISKKERK